MQFEHEPFDAPSRETHSWNGNMTCSLADVTGSNSPRRRRGCGPWTFGQYRKSRA